MTEIQDMLPVSRQTKYAAAVAAALQDLTHATNAELLEVLKQTYPEVSATTIHRVTSRMKTRGLIGCAPKTPNGSERYDNEPAPHHHFMCGDCGELCDIPNSEEAQMVVTKLKKMAGACALVDALTLQGRCKKCVKIGGTK